ncbi:dephospho-CoA kinase [Paenibacillus beijingensis]|uniref:Dephospho-CoA kinase n=1 Tax=Paenibacillus beijingensis TaxID=1126833 RepID=A0A0D5NF64_9BACL|nr:dephospho-CoA kinase [Paenibacillus beijingensis]AJY73563.1 dephospho-CoA kinase [Paenibacillus beijingensis]
MIIGLTGGIACGKSTVGAMLIELGALLVDADHTAREVVLPGEKALDSIVERFGQAVLNADGTLNRAALGQKVFGAKELLEQLESILHPAIRERMQAKIEEYKRSFPGRLIVADIPLLFETGQDARYEGVMVVYIPREMQIRRLMERNHMPMEEAMRRVDLQMDIEEKKKRADWLIDNSGTREQTRAQVERFWKEMRFS